MGEGGELERALDEANANCSSFSSLCLLFPYSARLCAPCDATNESSSQCPAVSDLVHVSGSDTAIPDHGLYTTSEALPLKPKNTKKKVTIDEINEIHLAVLQKEQIKLDLEIENLHLKKREIMLRIQELESKSNFFSC